MLWKRVSAAWMALLALVSASVGASARPDVDAGKAFGIRGGDGVQRTLLQTHGGLNGKTGIYEFIIDEGGAITHQRFIRGGRITGVPNQVVR